MIFRLYFKDIISLSDNVFEIKAKYHNFIVSLLISTHILSYQDDIIVRSLFLPLGTVFYLSLLNISTRELNDS